MLSKFKTSVPRMLIHLRRSMRRQRLEVEMVKPALKRLFGHILASKKRHNQNVEVLCRLILWSYGGLNLA